MKIINNEKGAILVMTTGFMLVFTLFGLSTVYLSGMQNQSSEKQILSTQAFWLAEAGVNKALDGLRSNYFLTGVPSAALGAGGYSVTIGPIVGETRIVTAQGFIPSTAPFRVKRVIQVTVRKLSSVSSNFYNNALYVAGNIDISGGSYSITGNVAYSGTISNTNNINGTTTRDSSISPMALLNFDQLRTISQSQGNYHDAQHLDGPFPTSFWYDQSAGIPNVIFLEGNLSLSGNTTVGGFFVVGGDVTYNAVISGNVSVNGCIYTSGSFTINGGGHALNVDGGVWAGSGAILHGGITIAYKNIYMQSIGNNLGVGTDVQITSWQEAVDQEHG